MLISTMEIYHSWQSPIYDAEKYLKDTCKEYYIDYNTCECRERESVTEGLLSGFVNIVKTIFQKAIAFLVKLWKTIVNFVKSIIKRAADFFKRLLGSGSKKPVNIKAPIISKPGQAEIKEFKTVNDIQTHFKNSINAASQEIHKFEQKSIGDMKRSEQAAVKGVTESFMYAEPIDEVAVYNKTTDKTNKESEKYAAGRDFNKAYNDAIEQQITALKEIGFPDDKIADVKKVYSELSYQGNDKISHASVANITAIDMNMARALVESNDVCAMYEDLKSASIERIFKRVEEIRKDPRYYTGLGFSLHDFGIFGTQTLLTQINGPDNDKYTENDIKQYLAGTYFPTFDDISDKQERESAIRKWVKLRVNWNQSIIKALNRMIHYNQKMLSLTTNEVEVLATQLKNDDLSGVRNLLEANKDKIISKDLKLIDGRKIGLRGCICISNHIAEDMQDLQSDKPTKDFNHSIQGWYCEVSRFWTTDTPITYLTKYDVTVVGHGDDDKDNKQWIIEDIVTPKGARFEIVKTENGVNFIRANDLVNQLIKEGFKRINIVSCNPGHYHLPESVLNNKKVLVRMSLTSTLLS